MFVNKDSYMYNYIFSAHHVLAVNQITVHYPVQRSIYIYKNEAEGSV